jgi:hypothetical protein
LKNLPPTTEAFMLHLKRVHFQTIIWKNANKPDPPFIEAIDYGWSKDTYNTMLAPVGLPRNMSPVPEEVLAIIKCICSSYNTCHTARCGCVIAKLSCSVFCSCHAKEHCANERTKHVNSNDFEDADFEAESHEYN